MNTLRDCHLPDRRNDRSPPSVACLALPAWLLAVCGRLLCLLCLCWAWPAARAITPVDITRLDVAEEHQISTNIIPAAEWLDFHDPGLAALDEQDLLQVPESDWHNVSQLPASLAMSSRHVLWFRMTLQNRDEPAQSLIVYDTSTLTDSLDVYVAEPGGQHVTRGQAVPAHQSGMLASRISIPPSSTRDVYIRLSGYHSPYISLRLSSENGYAREEYGNQLLYGIINGMMLGLTLYNLLLGLKTRQMMYYAYTLLGCTNVATIAINQNVLTGMVPLLGAAHNNDIKLAMPLLVSASQAFFLQVFFDSRKNNPRVHLLLTGYIAAILQLDLLFLLGTPMQVTSPVYGVLTVFSTILLFYLCLTNLHHRRSSMLFATVGLLMPLLSGIFTVLLASGSLSNAIPYTATNLFLHVIEMLAFSFAMANRVRQLQEIHACQMQSANDARIISDAHNRLLAHLNHELRTPLNGILGAAEILLHKAETGERHIFSMIHQTALPLKHLIDDMINIRAITENRQSLQHVRFNLHTLLQECMDIFLPIAHNKRIRLFFRIDSDIPTEVSGDPQRLRQILLNLIGNACKFTNDGDVGVQVSKATPKDGQTLLYHFEVTDSGHGINQADQQRLFQSFETGPALSNQQPGTGLGLSIVHELSELLGGRCGYSNQQPVGSLFWFTATLVVATRQQGSGHAHPAFNGLPVLVLDESNVIREQLALHNSARGRFTGTADPDAAGQLLATGEYRLLIVHRPLLSDKLQQACAEQGMLLLCYVDQSEALQEKMAGSPTDNDIIIRNTSIDIFSQQLGTAVAQWLKKRQPPQTLPHTERAPHVLVAEDIPTNRFIIQAMLESLGIDPVMCENGKQACTLYQQHVAAGTPFDAILMDCEMPVQDGFASTRQIRQYEQSGNLQRTTIIALTAHTEAAYRQRSEECGMDFYLTKPVSLDSMRLLLQHTVRRNA